MIGLLTLLALVLWALFWLGPRLKLWRIDSEHGTEEKYDGK